MCLQYDGPCQAFTNPFLVSSFSRCFPASDLFQELSEIRQRHIAQLLRIHANDGMVMFCEYFRYSLLFNMSVNVELFFIMVATSGDCTVCF